MPNQLPRNGNEKAAKHPNPFKNLWWWERPTPSDVPKGARYCKELHAIIPADLVLQYDEYYRPYPEMNIFQEYFGKKHIGDDEDIYWWVRGLTHQTIKRIPLKEARKDKVIKYRGTGVVSEEEERNHDLLRMANTQLTTETLGLATMS